MEEKVIVAKRGLIGLHAAAGAAAIAAGVFLMSISPSLPDTGRASGMSVGLAGVLLCLGGFGAVAASIVRLGRPPRLVLRPAMLIVKRTFSDERRFRWGDVKEFYVTGQPPRPGSMFAQSDAVVSVRLADSQGLMTLASGSSSGFGRDDVLPAVDFGMSASSLAAMLNDYRAKAVATAT